jgi:hypothetical protein
LDYEFGLRFLLHIIAYAKKATEGFVQHGFGVMACEMFRI